MLHSPLPPLFLSCLHSCQSQSGALCPNLKPNRTYFLLVFALVCNSRTEVCLCVCVSSTCHVTQRHCHADNARQEAAGRQSVSQSSSIFCFFPLGGVLPLFGSCISFTFSMSLGSFSPLSVALADIRNLPLQINCQVMAVTSLLPSLPPPALLPLLLFINARVNAMISLLSLLACCEIFYAQFMLIWPQFSHKGIRQQLPLSLSPFPSSGTAYFYVLCRYLCAILFALGRNCLAAQRIRQAMYVLWQKFWGSLHTHTATLTHTQHILTHTHKHWQLCAC